ncbi:unnamed protein product [Caenorhabditis bovis]|uniref:Uncharacterized protein n=1 Tax=Caenorhabditis bovis TaxID=2654633 RepID=A0A8S1EQN9_9PELO|nr:unnamed protein product [Caenorhabditis bovis]
MPRKRKPEWPPENDQSRKLKFDNVCQTSTINWLNDPKIELHIKQENDDEDEYLNMTEFNEVEENSGIENGTESFLDSLKKYAKTTKNGSSTVPVANAMSSGLTGIQFNRRAVEALIPMFVRIHSKSPRKVDIAAAVLHGSLPGSSKAAGIATQMTYNILHNSNNSTFYANRSIYSDNQRKVYVKKCGREYLANVLKKKTLENPEVHSDEDPPIIMNDVLDYQDLKQQVNV